MFLETEREFEMNKNSNWFAISMLITSLVLCVGSAVGQSTDQSSPTPITTNELSIKGPRKNNQLYYYSFTGGPGEVTLTISVTAKTGSTFVGIKVFDASLNALTYHNMSADTGSPGMTLKKFDVGEKQTLIMSFTSDSSLGECKIKFGGAVEMTAAESSANTPSTNASSAGPISSVTDAMPNATTQPNEQMSSAGSSTPGKNKTFVFSLLDAVGQRFNIPANGKLRIEMKDGSVQEIDLAQVKQLLIKK